MSTLIASIANLAIRTAKRSKKYFNEVKQFMLLVSGKADWTITFKN